MERRKFVSIIGAGMAMSSLGGLRTLSNSLATSASIMPVLFVGHGSPMNGIEENQFSNYWKKLATEIEKPKAVICISAHWLTKGTFITAMDFPRTIHDFGGFPQALFDIQYNAPGDILLANETKELVTSVPIELDHEWGLDHGTWTVVRHMYPEADIPVLQLSIDYPNTPQFHFELGEELKKLRQKGVLIIGSGNVVHNLRLIDWQAVTQEKAYDWAAEIDLLVKDKILNRDFNAVVNYSSLHSEILKAVPTPDHYFPLLYTLGLANSNDKIEVFNEIPVCGSITMTSYQFG